MNEIVEEWLGENTQERVVLETLRVHFLRHGGNVREAARSLGVSHTTVYRGLGKLRQGPEPLPVAAVDAEGFQGVLEFRDLPWPPSVNHYYGAVGSRRFLTKRARAFRRRIRDRLQGLILEGYPWLPRSLPLEDNLDITVALHPPTRGVYDNDNYCKGLYDGCTHAGLWKDDRQIRVARIGLCDPVKEGAIHLKIQRHEGFTW